MPKKIYVDEFVFSAIGHLQKASITASSDPQSSAYRRKYYCLFKQNVLSVHV